MPNKQLNNPVEALAFCMFGEFFFEMPEARKKTTLELCELRLERIRHYGYDLIFDSNKGLLTNIKEK